LVKKFSKNRPATAFGQNTLNTLPYLSKRSSENASRLVSDDLWFEVSVFFGLRLPLAQTTLIYQNVSTVWQHIDCLPLRHSSSSERLFFRRPA
jgi:hypothetical protein